MDYGCKAKGGEQKAPQEVGSRTVIGGSHHRRRAENCLTSGAMTRETKGKAVWSTRNMGAFGKEKKPDQNGKSPTVRLFGRGGRKKQPPSVRANQPWKEPRSVGEWAREAVGFPDLTGGEERGRATALVRKQRMEKSGQEAKTMGG